MTVRDLADAVRLDVSDQAKTRWSDAQVLAVLGRAFRRLAHVLHNNAIEAGRSIQRFDAQPGQQAYPLPLDFLADHALYRDDTHARLTRHGDDSWLGLDNPEPLSAWIVRGEELLVAAPPAAAVPLTLVYWPLPDTTDMDLDAPTPYAGRFDDLPAEYAALRLKNVDEMDLGQDARLLEDLETAVLTTFRNREPVTLPRRGWLA